MYQVPQSVPAMIVRAKTTEESDPSVAARVVLEPSIDNTGSPYDWKDTHEQHYNVHKPCPSRLEHPQILARFSVTHQN